MREKRRKDELESEGGRRYGETEQENGGER